MYKEYEVEGEGNNSKQPTTTFSNWINTHTNMIQLQLVLRSEITHY